MTNGKTLRKQSTSSLMLTDKVVENLRRLSNGWDGEAAKKPAVKAVRKTKKVLSCIENGRMPFPSVNVMSNGCITLTWVSPTREILINVDADGDIQFVTSLKKFDAEAGDMERLDSEGAVTDLLTIDHMMAWYAQDRSARC